MKRNITIATILFLLLISLAIRYCGRKAWPAPVRAAWFSNANETAALR
jgi:hypothetical protein